MIKKADLELVLQLLEESKRLHEGGYQEAHEKATEARLLLAKIIGENHD